MSAAVLSRDLEAAATAFAAQGAAEAEEQIAALAADAIRRWQLDEATFWQRVKFRARLLRAAGDGRRPCEGE